MLCLVLARDASAFPANILIIYVQLNRVLELNINGRATYNADTDVSLGHVSCIGSIGEIVLILPLPFISWIYYIPAVFLNN